MIGKDCKTSSIANICAKCDRGAIEIDVHLDPATKTIGTVAEGTSMAIEQGATFISGIFKAGADLLSSLLPKPVPTPGTQPASSTVAQPVPSKPVPVAQKTTEIPACITEFYNLQKLKIRGQRLGGVKNIAGMNIKELDLGVNKITKLDARDLPPTIEKLDASYNPIPRIDNPEMLDSVRELLLSGTDPFDMRGIEKIPVLQRLDLTGRKVVPEWIQFEGRKVHLSKNLKDKELVALKNYLRSKSMPPVQRQVPSRVAPVQRMPPDVETDVCSPNYSNFGLVMDGLGLTGIPMCMVRDPRYDRVKNVSLAGNSISDMMMLSQFANPDLERINLSNNKIEFIDGIAGFSKLKHLDLSNNAITKLDNLSHLKRLKTLNISGNPITSLSSIQGTDQGGVQGLENLEELYARNTNITGLQGIAGIGHLKSLKVLDLTGVTGLPEIACDGKIYSKYGGIYRDSMINKEVTRLRECLAGKRPMANA